MDDDKALKQQYDFYVNERDILLKLNASPATTCSCGNGFTHLLDHGYDERHNLHFLILGRLDEDLSQIVKRAGKLSLQATVNMGLELVSKASHLFQLIVQPAGDPA